MKKIIQFTILIIIVIFSAQILAEENTLNFKRISQVVASPDDKEIAFVVYQVEDFPSGKEWRYSLYLRDEKQKIHLLLKDKKISSIVWSPDGEQITYLAKGKKFQSIWNLNVKSGQRNKLIEFSQDIESFKWSPDGNFILFSSINNKDQSSAKLIPIDASKDYKNISLYLLSIKDKTLKLITSESINISTGYDWSPDSSTVVISYQPRVGELYINQSKIALIDINHQTKKKILYTENYAGIEPFYSPDGQWIAFQSNRAPLENIKVINNDITTNNKICVVNTATLKTNCLSNTFNENPQIIGWNKNSKGIFVLDAYKTTGYLIYEINLNPSAPVKLISNIDGFIEPLTISLNNAHDMFGFGYETVNEPPEGFISATQPFHLVQISPINSQSKISLGDAKIIHWKSTEDMNIEGVLVVPRNYDAKKKYPLYVAIHGGPAGVWSKRYLGGCDEYDEMIDPTTCWKDILDLGFIIFQPNPRGSTGYGLSFRLANFKDFGGGDYRDIMSGVDYLIKKGIVDSNHLAIGGWSFGGYMTAWIISHTDRFKAAVEGDGNTDFISFSGTSDIPDYYIRYLGNTFWDNNKLYLERAPIMHVKNIHTPLLILEGEKDNRVPPGQSYELYTALMLQNKPVKMLLLPEQGHVPTDANIIFESIKAVNNWLKKA